MTFSPFALLSRQLLMDPVRAECQQESGENPHDSASRRSAGVPLAANRWAREEHVERLGHQHLPVLRAPPVRLRSLRKKSGIVEMLCFTQTI